MKLHLKQDESDNTNISNTNYSAPAEVFNISIIIIMKGHTTLDEKGVDNAVCTLYNYARPEKSTEKFQFSVL